MKKYLLIIVISSLSLSAMGWGATGHRVTGYIADKHLSKKARQAMERILGQQSLAMASTWMDDVKSDSTYDKYEDWHWVTIEDNETYDQTKKNPKGDLIYALEKIISELKSKKLSPKEETERVKMLIHLIGDLHQPLHVGRADRGGNDVKVTWFGGNSNLHRVWDSDMIDGTRLSYTELAESLYKPTAAEVKAWQSNSVRDWAKESIALRKQVYDIGDGKLGYQYQYKYFNIARDRMAQAGVRLAGLLNAIYG
ncbi:MAG TPA: S1/P1 nuclease [Cyclobacteriaceae bacterium]|nr:S1/P1 nuclease [Cyclobacteriaceae bacterium]